MAKRHLKYGNFTVNWDSTYLRSQQYGHISKGRSIILHGHLLNYVHRSIICNSQNLETTLVSLNQRSDKENVGHLHSGVLLSNKRQWHLKICMQMDKTRKTVLIEVTQTQKNEHGIFSLIGGFSYNQILQSMSPEKPSNKENPKRNIYRCPWEGEIDAIS